MQTLYIDVVDKIATYRYRYGDLVCGNSDYRVQFSFDDEWADLANKTARFIWNGKYFDVPLDSTNACDVPVLTNTESVLVGVYAGDLSTTTPAKIYCKKSILCGGEEPNPGTGQHYTTEAQKAAKEASASASTAAFHAGNAASRANDAATSAQAAADAVQAVNDVKDAAIEAAKLEPKIANNSMRIEKIEDKIGLDGDIVKIESGYKNGGYFDAEMYRYIRILKLGSNGSFEEIPEYSSVTVKPSYITTINGFSVVPSNLGKCPEYGVGNCDDERYSNYIFFDGGKAYYHQGCRAVSSTKLGRFELADGEVVLEGHSIDEGSYIIGLAEPIITDISKDFAFDGVIDLGELGFGGDEYGERGVGFTGNGYIEFAYMTKEGA